MSRENQEIVRSYLDRLNRTMDAYAADPRPLEEIPSIEEVFALLHPEAQWSWPLTPETFCGRAGLLKAVEDWLALVDSWHIDVEEVIDAGDQVISVQLVRGQGKGSGAPVDQRIFSVVTIEDGRIVRIEDHLERSEALEAVGLRE